MAIHTLPNIAAYSAQVMLLVALATALSWLLRIDTASVRYGYWRVVFGLCLLLPVLQSRQTEDVAAVGSTSVAVSATVSAELPGAAANPLAFEWLTVVLAVLGAGAVARLLWLGISLVRLRRLRRCGEAAVDSAVHSEMGEIIGAVPEIRYVQGLRQPVTFGLVRPVVLLPSDLANHSEEIQRAVLSHELFHVKRRDWGWLLFEELVCAVLWFNPAIWWLVSRIHLAREAVVDELAVLATGRRRAYVAALMAFADDTSLAPVSAFGGRAHLFTRIVLLSKEAGMSSRRLVFTFAAVAAALAAGTWQAVQAFPLTQSGSVRQAIPGPLEQRAKPVTPENPIPRRTNFEAPFYPAEARAAGARGSVTLMVTLDELGRVAEARRVGLVVESTNPKVSLRWNNTSTGDEMRFLVNQSPEQSDRLRAVALAMEASAIRAVQSWRYEPPADGPISFPILISLAEGTDAGQGTVAPAAPAAGRGVRAEGVVRVGGSINAPVKIKDVRPVYPPEAQVARVAGVVILEVRISPEGIVEDTHVLRSIPMLDQAAVDAVMQWRFRPTLLNGQAVPVIMTVTVNFALEKSPVFPREVVPEGPQPQVNERGGSIPALPGQMPVIVKEVKPAYSREAFEAGAEGTVEVEATIADGRVTDARVIRGIPMLDALALDAARQWEFTRLPQPVTVKIEFSFAKRGNR